jgi:hypothetical protein
MYIRGLKISYANADVNTKPDVGTVAKQSNSNPSSIILSLKEIIV